jgi:hypothetical protein
MAFVDFYTAFEITMTAFVLPALAGFKWYMTLRSKKAAIQQDIHAIRVAVDDVDDAVQAGTLPPADAVLKIWDDVLNVKKATARAVAASQPPVVDPAPTTPPAP